MSNFPQDLLAMLFREWRKVADETVRCLGEEPASLFGYLYLETFDIHRAISASYADEVRQQSIVFIELIGLLKELNGLHVLFLSGNYPIVLSRLRFNWERLFRALYADTYAQENPDTGDGPGLTLDDKHNWLTQREDRLNWPRLIAQTLARLFAADAPGQVEGQFRPLWDRLCRCVHPSGDLREKLVGESVLHALDAFDEGWARETLADAAEVFGAIWLAVLSRFPAAVDPLLADPQAFRACPQAARRMENGR